MLFIDTDYLYNATGKSIPSISIENPAMTKEVDFLITELDSSSSDAYLYLSLADNCVSIIDYYPIIDRNEKIKLVEGYGNLKNGWNGYGAEKISKPVIDKAKEILLSIDMLPKIFPTGRNSIQFEYEKNNGDYLEFEIFNDKIVYLRIIGDQEKEQILELTPQLTSIIKDKIIRFYVA